MYPSKNQNPFFTQNQLVKMKNLIVLLLLLVNVGVTTAQYNLVLTGTSAPYTCTINNTGTWTDQDLLTWIFPDGQYKQKLIDFNDLGQFVQGSNSIEWFPYKPNFAVLSGEIKAFVAKKGGSGTPPPNLMWFGGATASATVNTTNITPVGIDLPTDEFCSLGSLWDFSPVAPNYLVISYTNVPCSPTSNDHFVIKYKTDELSVDYSQSFGNNSELIEPLGSILIGSTNYTQLKIKNLPTNLLNGIFNNVYLKVQSLLPAGTPLDIALKSQRCSASPQFYTEATYNYMVQGGPHDPNYKIVNIQTLTTNQTGPVELIYTIQFHNNGSAPVKEVIVTDHLPFHLNPETFEVMDFQPMNGIDHYTSLYNLHPNDQKKITFTGPGLPGLGETSSSYTYSQTIFRFKFKVKTKPNIQTAIDNTANIVFYDHISKKMLEPIVTNVAKVKYIFPPPEGCSPWKNFWRNFFNIFRREKLPPCRKPIDRK